MDDTHKSRSVVQSDSNIPCVHTVRARVNMSDTDPAALLRAQNTCVYDTSHLIHSQHGSGAVIVASRKSGRVTQSCCLVERRAPEESVERGAPGDAGVKTVKRERSSRTVTAARARDQTWATSVVRELSTAGSTACQQTMSTPEEQMTMAVQQLYVRLQQFQETLATILQAARNELVEQVQNATSTTTYEDPMKRADRLFKLRSYLGIVDQRNELEPATTEESSTPRLNRALSTQMYYILVMMKKDTVQVSQCKSERGVRREEARE